MTIFGIFVVADLIRPTEKYFSTKQWTEKNEIQRMQVPPSEYIINYTDINPMHKMLAKSKHVVL